MVMMAPVPDGGSQVGFDRFALPGGVTHHLAAFAKSLVRLDVRAGRHLLQSQLDRLCALLALESKESGRLAHDMEGNSY
jgi:hypothetical protein